MCVWEWGLQIIVCVCVSVCVVQCNCVSRTAKSEQKGLAALRLSLSAAQPFCSFVRNAKRTERHSSPSVDLASQWQLSMSTLSHAQSHVSCSTDPLLALPAAFRSFLASLPNAFN